MGDQFWTGSRVSKRLTELPILSNLKDVSFRHPLPCCCRMCCPPPGPLPTCRPLLRPVRELPLLCPDQRLPGCARRARGRGCDPCPGEHHCWQQLSALPGIEAHAAAEAAVKESNRPGFSAHAAAVNAVLLSQGRIPEGVPQAHLAHFQAEQAVRIAAGF